MTHPHPRQHTFLRPRRLGAVTLVLFMSFAIVSESPAPPEQWLPTLPNFFKRSGSDLQETSNAPSGPGGMCILPTGEHIISCHQFFQPQHRVMMLNRKGDWLPFPNEEMNTPGSGAPVVLDAVLGLACDPKGIVWMLDNGRRTDTPPKLVAWDTKRDAFHKVLPINAQSLSTRSFLKNVVLDPSAPFMYISDPADGVSSAIIVVDTQTGLTRRVLEGHRSVQMDPTLDLELDGKSLEVRRPDGGIATPLTGVSPLAIDRKGEWLYYGPRNGSTLFKIKTELLRRTDLAANVLESQVTGVSPKPICDSMTIDAKGRIYFGDISRGSIDYVTPDEEYLNLRLLVRDPRIVWPSGITIGSDGNLHFFGNQLHRTPFFNGGKDITAPPFSIFETRPLPASRFGF